MVEDDRKQAPLQPPLFDVTTRGDYGPRIGSVGALTPTASLEVARYWYRRHLEQGQHPKNTISSYLYDLAIFEEVIGRKRIDEITGRDVARYLGEANTRSTRKRRLTSVSGLFRWLVNGAKMLDKDPTASFYPDHIPLKTPRPLFEKDQDALLAAAASDSPRSVAMCWLMMRLGLSRSEVLGLRRSDIDFASDGSADVYIFYDQPRYRDKERKLRAGLEFKDLYDAFLKEYAPEELLFEMLPQSVNKLVERVAKSAGIAKKVSPQTLRDTFSVSAARDGASEEDLLTLLGLAPDARNRDSVRRYIKLAGPAVNEASVPGQRESE